MPNMSEHEQTHISRFIKYIMRCHDYKRSQRLIYEKLCSGCSNELGHYRFITVDCKQLCLGCSMIYKVSNENKVFNYDFKEFRQPIAYRAKLERLKDRVSTEKYSNYESSNDTDGSFIDVMSLESSGLGGALDRSVSQGI